MKKSAQSSKKSKDTALQRRAENNITIVNCGIVIYALVLVCIYTMSQSSATVSNAHFAKYALMYVGLAGFMATAAYAAYKSNKSFLKYSLMCLFVAISSASLIFCENHGWGSRVSYFALFIAFIFNCVYAYMTDKNTYYSSKKNQLIFKVTVGIVFLILFVILVLAFFNVLK